MAEQKRGTFSDQSTNPEYYQIAGIAYEDFKEKKAAMKKQVDDVKPPPSMKNSDLVGCYDLLYYRMSRYRDGCYESRDLDAAYETISRAVPGELVITETIWEDKPALHGKWRIDADVETKRGWSVAGYVERLSLECEVDGEMIEKVHLSGKDGMMDDVFEDMDKNMDDDKKYFIAERRDFRSCQMETGKLWWWDLPMPNAEGYEEGYYYYCAASLEILECDVPLGVKSDEPVYIDLHWNDLPKTHGTRPKNLAHAKELIANYENGTSDSWMTRHLKGFTPSLALMVRRFLTPPPVLMLKRGDLILRMDEPDEMDCEKLYVFRKKEQP